MKAPRRHRSSPRTIVPCPPGTNVLQIAAQAHYIGSPEHKDAPSFAGWPRPRADAAKCDRSFADRQADITTWLQDAIRNGTTGDWSHRFPRHVWGRVQGRVYEARLVNPENGDYKAYELNPHEWPEGI
jgi:hypothetical protein